MTMYRHVQSGELFTEQQLRELFPNTSFPVQFVCPGDFVAVPDVEPERTPEQQRMEAKMTRDSAVRAIKVTTATGKTFDGDEVSQERMLRAITVLRMAGLAGTPWTLADNTEAMVTVQELEEALMLACSEQARLWSGA